MEDSAKGTAASTKDEAQLTSPPPPKKLKQACLPFKVLTPKTDANVGTPQSQKKRKLPVDATGPVKAPKNQRSSEKNKNKKPEDVENKESEKPALKKGGPLEKFVQTKKDENKSAVPSIVVDLTETEKQATDLKENDAKPTEAVSQENADEQLEVTGKKEEKPEVEEKKEDIKTEATGEDEIDSDKEKREEKSDEKTGSSEGKDENAHVVAEEKKEETKIEEEKKDESKESAANTLAPEAGEELKSPVPTKPKAAKTPASSRKVVSKEERERLKKEREEKKQKEKEEKERQKQEEKERKEREKEEKKKKLEEEKKEKLEQKKKEQEEKLRQREEEKKKKQEEKKLEQEKKEKEQERLKEEKRLEKQRLKDEKEEERQKAELEKLKVTKAQKSMFQSFFTKKVVEEVQEENTEGEYSLFMPFQVKADTKLAPILRVEKSDLCERLEKFDPLFESQEHKTLYLEELKKSSGKQTGSYGSTWPYEPEDSCCVVLDEEGGKPAKPKTDRMKAKFLKFRENYRPAYYGTWRKISDDVTGRKPLGKDTAILDYEVDSDDEWEEEEPGESLSGPEDEEEEEDKEDEDEDDDGFYVPHGYLSEGEGCEDEEDDDVTPERLKARQLAKAKAFELEQSKKKVEVLKPKSVGCCWDKPGKTLNFMEEVLLQYKMVLLHSAGSLPIPVVEKRGDESLEIQKKASKKDKKAGPQSQHVPQEAYPDLIRLVHGNRLGLPRLIKQFREFWYLKESGKLGEGESAEAANKESTPDDSKAKADKVSTTEDAKAEKDGTPEAKAKKYSISKRQLERTIKEIAVYEKRTQYNKKHNCWYINDDVLQKYEMENLLKLEAPSPTSGRNTPKLETPKQITNSITKFTKAGITPKVHKPTPVKPTESAATPKSATGGKRIIEMFNKVPPKARKILAPGVATENIIKLDGESEDSDCAIVGMELKADSKQPSVMSMFNPQKRKSGVHKDEATEVKRTLLEGDKPVAAKPDDKTSEGDKTSKTMEQNPDAKNKKKQETKEKPKKTPAKPVVKKKKAEETAKKTPGQKKLNVQKKTKPPTQNEKKPTEGEKPKGTGSESSPMEID